MTTYQAGGTPFLYPDLGDELPSKGAKVNLLTIGGISTTGPYNPDFCIGWAPLNSVDQSKVDRILRFRWKTNSLKARLESLQAGKSE
jgi:hypothetical protein